MRTWVEIDKENLKYNVLKLKEIANNRKVLGVVRNWSKFLWCCKS